MNFNLMNFYMKILNIFAINNIPPLISFNVRVLSTSSPLYIFFFSSTTSSSRNIFYTESDVLISSIQMGSAIWYKKRNGGTKEREKLREKETTEKEHFADGIKKEKGKSSKEEKEKKSERTKSIARTIHACIIDFYFSFCHLFIY